MARSWREIYDSLIAEKNNQPNLNALQPAIDDSQTLLDNLTTPSKVAEWRLWLAVFAVGIMVHEQLWDVAKSVLQAIADSAIPGTSRWYQEQCFKFQLGHTLQWINGKYQYPTIDLNSQIVKRAAVVDGGTVIIKVAKLVSGVVTPLDAVEYNAFTNYIHQVKYAGTATLIISDVADLLKLEYKIYYDPLILKANGESILNAGQYPVEDAINNYITQLPFDGELQLSSLTDAIQYASGVKDAVNLLAEAKYGLIPYQAIVDSYSSFAGYLTIDPLFPLNTNITYVPKI